MRRALARPATLATAALAALGCRRPAPLASCADDLAGVWAVPDEPTASGEPRRYHVIDRGGAIELYPMFDDSVVAPGDRKATTADAVIAAPAAIDLTRAADGTLTGTLVRRFQRGAATCILRTPARLHDCAGDRATLEVTPLAPPVDWARCAPPDPRPRTWSLVHEHD